MEDLEALIKEIKKAQLKYNNALRRLGITYSNISVTISVVDHSLTNGEYEHVELETRIVQKLL